MQPPRARASMAWRAVATVALLFSLESSGANNLESAVKASFLSKFAAFVQWPPSAFAPPGTPLVICVQGEDAVAALAERAAYGQAAWSRPLVVRRLASVGPGSGCSVAYIAGSPAQSVGQALGALQRAPVLTVTDGGLAKGGRGMIDFIIVGNRVSFDIDDAAAAEAGLTISSKLLSLARSVNRR